MATLAFAARAPATLRARATRPTAAFGARPTRPTLTSGGWHRVAHTVAKVFVQFGHRGRGRFTRRLLGARAPRAPLAPAARPPRGGAGARWRGQRLLVKKKTLKRNLNK